MAVMSVLLSLAVALASADASARSCWARAPGPPATSSTCSPFRPPWAPALIVPKVRALIEDGNQDVATLVGHAELANNLSEDVLFVLKVRSMGQCHSIDNLALR